MRQRQPSLSKTRKKLTSYRSSTSAPKMFTSWAWPAVSVIHSSFLPLEACIPLALSAKHSAGRPSHRPMLLSLTWSWFRPKSHKSLLAPITYWLWTLMEPSILGGAMSSDSSVTMTQTNRSSRRKSISSNRRTPFCKFMRGETPPTQSPKKGACLCGETIETISSDWLVKYTRSLNLSYTHLGRIQKNSGSSTVRTIWVWCLLWKTQPKSYTTKVCRIK